LIKEKAFLRAITYAPLLFIPLFVAAIAILTYQIYTQNFETSVKELERSLIKSEKKAVKNKILHTVDFILFQKSLIKERLTSRVKGRVETAFKIAQNIYDRYKDTKSEEAIKNIIKTTLKTFSWNNGESFIWIVDYDGVSQLAPSYLKYLEGSSIIDFKNANGRYVIQDEIAICKEKGEGFLRDRFTKPNKNSNKQYEQVAFVKAFGHYNWYFGSAEYLDTATKKTDKELFSMIDRIDNIGSNYIFLANIKGDILVNKDLPQFIGKNVNITDKLVQETVKNILNSLKNRQSTTYIYDWFNKSTNKMDKKYSYIQKIPNTDWVIGSGFYLSEIQSKLMSKKVDMFQVYNSRSRGIVYIAILVVMLTLILSLFVSKKIKQKFYKYQVNIGDKTNQLQELNQTLEQKVIKRTAELEKVKDAFEELANTDALTHIHNRYSLMKIISAEISRSHRYQTPLSIIMYDIDFFKNVNDTHGHDVGDSILVSLSNLIKKNLRDIDTIGRYGGEEFLIVLPNTPLGDAKSFAERLRKEVDEYSFEIVDKITISIGIIELQPNENIDQVFKRVDDLLYKSKNSGRNKISY